jgi:hypothetical protein
MPCVLIIRRRRDPRPWLVALVGMALRFGLFMMMLVRIGTLSLPAHITQLLR